jgi:hypothetical protein
VAIIFWACKNTEKATARHLLKASDKEVVAQYKNQTFNFNTVSGKAALTLLENDKKKSFKITYRIKKDSVIWISITPMLGLEAARVMITPDSIFMLDRLHKTYYKNTTDSINHLLKTDLNFALLQNILVANPFNIEPENKKDKIYVRRNRREQLYFVSNAKRRKYRKAVNKDKEKYKETIETIWIYPDNYKTAKFNLNDFEENKSFEAQYAEYQIIDNQIFPKIIQITVKNNKNFQLTIDYLKVNIDNPLKFSFHIPSKYERID